MMKNALKKGAIMLLSASLCAIGPITALASTSDSNEHTVDSNGNWVYTRVVDGKKIDIHVSAGAVPGDGSDAYSNPGFKFPGRGFVYSGPMQNSKTGYSQKQISDEIKEMTNLNVKSNNGAEIYLEGEEDWIAAQKQLASDGVTEVPQTKVPALPFKADWNNISGYAYPSYYSSAGSFTTMADTPHHVKFYSTDGAYAGSVNAVLVNGKYVTDTSIDGGDYYAVIFNDADGVSSNATYTIK